MVRDDPSPSPPPPPRPAGYLGRSKRPLQALFFLLPLIVLYELGLVMYGSNQDIVARTIMRKAYQWVGVTGYYLPGLVAVVVLLCWHIARRDPWKPEPKLYPIMLAEACLLAAPPFVFMIVLTRQWTPAMAVADSASHSLLAAANSRGTLSGGGVATSGGGGDPWQTRLVFSVGAGIYEELLFRLIGIAVLHMVLVDVLRMPHRWGAVLAVVISSVAFALYHFTPSEMAALRALDRRTWWRCLFYTVAGLYFAVIYLGRGFGIAAGTHAMYDVFVLVLQETER
jgi:membrane protease YdiL (CAAX protease family)